MRPDRLRLELELRRADDPIEGDLNSEHGTTVSFTGWLELIAAVEAARAEDARRSAHEVKPPAGSHTRTEK
jgi:hypothetical protein